MANQSIKKCKGLVDLATIALATVKTWTVYDLFLKNEKKKSTFSFITLFSLHQIYSIMPVRSPNMNSTAVQDSQDFPKNSNIPPIAEKEETNENVSKEKLANMKLIMKTFVLGALREKEQVNYYIT